MKLKKIISLVLMCTMAMGLMTGCGTADKKSADSSEKTETTAANDDNAAADDREPTTQNTSSEDGRVLVVYYSATGNTKKAAELIAEITGGDMFEIQPAEKYTDEDLDWTNDNSRVSREHNGESRRTVELVSTTVDNWELYDTVFIGYPKMEYLNKSVYSA